MKSPEGLPHQQSTERMVFLVCKYSLFLLLQKQGKQIIEENIEMIENSPANGFYEEVYFLSDIIPFQ